VRAWLKSGAPWIWLTAGTVSFSLIMVFGLLMLIAVRGMGHFWPQDIAEVTLTDGERRARRIRRSRRPSPPRVCVRSAPVPQGRELRRTLSWSRPATAT
jgi:ABC-type phosphate transport system auxiliary subunit